MKYLLVMMVAVVIAGCTSSGEGGSSTPIPTIPPERSLVPMKLLGDASVENRVHSPNFDSATDLWQGYGAIALGSGLGPIALTRRTFAKTPTGQPVLEMPVNGRYLTGMARGGPAPLEASIWVGAPEGTTVRLEPYIIGMSQQKQTDVEVSLKADKDSTQVLDGVAWTRWHARIDDDLLGLCSFYFANRNASTEVYLSAPALQTTGASARGFVATEPGATTSGAPRVAGGAASAEKSAHFRQAIEEMHRRGAERDAASRAAPPSLAVPGH